MPTLPTLTTLVEWRDPLYPKHTNFLAECPECGARKEFEVHDWEFALGDTLTSYVVEKTPICRGSDA